jgi:hypothetical protein
VVSGRRRITPATPASGVPRWSGPLSVQPIQKYADFDKGPMLRSAMGDAYDKYLAKVRPMIVSTHGVIQTLVQNASLSSYSGKPPAWVIVATTNVLPGKGPEFATITAEEYVPAYKKAGVGDYWVFAANFGASWKLMTSPPHRDDRVVTHPRYARRAPMKSPMPAAQPAALHPRMLTRASQRHARSLLSAQRLHGVQPQGVRAVR